MKKIFGAIVLFAILSASNIFGYGYYTELIGGYTSVNMSKVNSDLITKDSGDGITNIQLGNAWFTGIDAMYIAPEGLGVHFRMEFIGMDSGEMTYNYTTNGYYYQDYQVTPYMVPLMLGLSYTFHGKGNPFTLTAGVYGGLADGYIDYYQHTVDTTNFDRSYEALFEGWGFCGEGVVNADLWFTKNFSLGLNLGYRFANISELTSVSSVYDSNGAFVGEAGGPLVGVSGNNIAADFSGMMLGVNLTYRFDGWWRRPHEEVIEYGW
jgi:hypothetical protein